jgi:acetyl esterase
MTTPSFFEALVRDLEISGPPPAPWDHMTAEWLAAQYPHLAGVAISPVDIQGPHGPVPARLYRAEAQSGRALVWVHGGGFIAGDLDMPEANWVGMELAARGIPVLSVDYTKALNGARHPIPSDDVLAAWRFAAQRADELFGVSADDLHLGGASAGANLSAGIALRLRDGDGPSPASLLLLYPLVHPVVPEASAATRDAVADLAPEQRFAPHDIAFVNMNYVGVEEGLRDPVAFPGLGVLTGLPPVAVIVSEKDDLRPSGELYAEQLAAAEVVVSLTVEADAAHGHLNEPGNIAALRSLDRMTSWILGGAEA